MAQYFQAQNLSNPHLPIFSPVSSGIVKWGFAALSWLVFVVVMMHPNRAIAKVTMSGPDHTLIEEYFSQEAEAHQACIVFATNYGYSPDIFCLHGEFFNPPFWNAGWLCSGVKYGDYCPWHFYLGMFYYPSQCPNGQVRNRDTGICEMPPKSNGCGDSCCSAGGGGGGGGTGGAGGPGGSGTLSVGNPINAGTGNKWQHEIDLPSSAFGLGFDRYYNTGVTTDTAHLGSGWTHAYSRRSTVQSSGAWVVIQRPGGKEFIFNQTAGTWTPDADVPDRLEEVNDSSNNRSGWRYTTADHTVETYNADGQLVAIVDRTGLTQTLTYSDASTPVTTAPTTGLLLRVADPAGRALLFSYDANSRISTLADTAGGVYRYGYDANNLISVTYPDGAGKTYH